MKNINRVIFASGSGTSRAPMATAIFHAIAHDRPIICEARGLIVQFPEPLNQKVEAVLISNGCKLSDYSSKQLMDSDFSENTLVITMEETQRQKILSEYTNATEENTRLLNELVGDELEVMDPYGGSVQTYGLCYEVLKASIEKLMRVLEA
ncbi:arsenate reductase/protein-tyrosine-phosphatase family protein [Pseudobutyrivibrio sp.]|uniref:arsenate reductase/protein-tyrosine-phosphatase family protein n=1 Tax=Pseudobutyrivibrio sp. TaxID=2014367 RepID=UPI0025E1DA52|nr:phosphotyrosine protein phosphatase [Pseudobutyrivibrio sp.]MBR5648173.1 phosphotyrosine protein phosphatase [Pseudobutyrivibrio sp.]